MKNLKVAKILAEIADMLEMEGVKYKPRAYRKASRTVESLSKDIEEVKKENELTELPGIGKSIAQKIEEIIETGSLKYYEDLKKKFPIDFESLLAVEGIGPKTIKLFYEKLAIKDLDDLENAAKKHKIRKLKGMGEKTEQKILENIEFARKRTGRNLLGYALPAAESLKKELAESEVIDRIEVAGSIRRRKETIGDIDILVTTKKPEEALNFFTKLESVGKVLAKGEAKSTFSIRMQT